MTRGTCARCGAEESIFWYPYAFAVIPVPEPASVRLPDCQRYALCDKCQQDFIEFMRNKRWPFFDAEKLKEMMAAEPMPIIVPAQEAKE